MTNTVRTPLRMVPADPTLARGVLARGVTQRVNLWKVPTARADPRKASATTVWLFGLTAYAQAMDAPAGVSLDTDQILKAFAANKAERTTITLARRALRAAGVLVPMDDAPDRYRLAASLWTEDAFFLEADIARVFERVRATPPSARNESVALTVTLYQLVLDRLADETQGTSPRTIEWTYDEAARILGVRRAQTLMPALARLERARCLTVERRPGRALRISLSADEGHSPLPHEVLATRLEADNGTELGRDAPSSRATSKSVAESIERAFALMQSGMISATEYAEWKAKELARI